MKLKLTQNKYKRREVTKETCSTFVTKLRAWMFSTDSMPSHDLQTLIISDFLQLFFFLSDQQKSYPYIAYVCTKISNQPQLWMAYKIYTQLVLVKQIRGLRQRQTGQNET